MTLKVDIIIPVINEFLTDYLKSYMENLDDEEEVKLLKKVTKRFKKEDVQESLETKLVKALKKKKRKNKDPNKPKRNLSPYIFFCTANREKIKEENSSLSSKEITQLLAKTWHETKNTPEVEQYNRLAREDKLRYDKENDSYVPEVRNVSGTTDNDTPKKSKKTSGRLKKPKTAYQLFMIDSRVVVKEDNPDFSFGEIQKKISVMWSELKNKSKEGDEEAIALVKKYQNMATECKNEYYRKLEAEGRVIENRVIVDDEPVSIEIPMVETDTDDVGGKPDKVAKKKNTTQKKKATKKTTKKTTKKVEKKTEKKVTDMDVEELIGELFE